MSNKMFAVPTQCVAEIMFEVLNDAICIHTQWRHVSFNCNRVINKKWLGMNDFSPEVPAVNPSNWILINYSNGTNYTNPLDLPLIH